MVVPLEKENTKMDNDNKGSNSLKNTLLDNIYMCQQSIVRSHKILENLAERPDAVEKHQEEILKMLDRMKTNILSFENKCNNVVIHKKPQEKHFKFRKRSVLSLKRSNGDSTEETDVELIGSSMHNSPQKGCCSKKQIETNGLPQVLTDTQKLPKSSKTTECVPNPLAVNITNDAEETTTNAAEVPNLNPIVIIANDATETKTNSVSTNGAGGIDGSSQKRKRSDSFCVENAGSITVHSDEDESDEDPIPFSRFDAQEPPDEAMDLEFSQNSIKKEDEEDESEVAKSEETVGTGEVEKQENELETEKSSVDDKAGINGTVAFSVVEDKEVDVDLLADFPSSSQEKADLLQLLTDKEKQDARDILDVEKALEELSDEDEDSSDLDNTDVEAAYADCSMSEDSSGGDESDVPDDEPDSVPSHKPSQKSESELDMPAQESEISSEESLNTHLKYISTVRECSVSLQRLDQMSDDEIERLCTLNNVNKRKCTLTPPPNRTKRVRKLSTTSESYDSSSSSDTIPYDFEKDAADLIDLLPGSPLQASELLNEIMRQDDSSAESSESETDLDSETDVEKSQKKKDEKDNTKTSEEKQGHEEGFDDIHKAKTEGDTEDTDGAAIHNAETEGETGDTDGAAQKLDTWRNDPLLRQRLWSDSDRESDSDSKKPDFKFVLTEEDESTNARNYKPKLRPFVIDDDDEDPEDPLEDPTIISDSSSDTSSDIEFVDEQNIDANPGPSQPGRRNIRAVLTDEELTFETQRAKEEEDERIQRLERRSRNLSSIRSQRDELVLDYGQNGQPVIVVDQGLKDHLKPHQIEGVKFMWEACYESLNMLKRSPGGGCILAHCMGLGKTLQVITLIHTLFRHEKLTGTRHVLIVCPLSTVLNWKNEFGLAIAKACGHVNMNISTIGNMTLTGKCQKVKQWGLKGGIIIMGYEAYEMMSNEKLSRKVAPVLYEDVQKALVNPGPNLVVCDEGHLIKNGKTLRNKALMKVNTKRRIILTGTPLQNNLTEYYHMVEFVKPRLLGTLQEYKNRFGDPIMNGQFHNSTPYDIKIMKKRNHVLTKLLKKTIQRVESSVLKSYLPEIMDYTLFIDLTPLQISHYKKYIDMVRVERLMSVSFFRDFQVTNYIGLHPYTLIRYNENSNKKKKKEQETIEFDDDHQVDNITNVAPEWWIDCTPEDVSTKIELGSKLKVVWAILEEAQKLGDKVLIFSSSLVELDCLEHFLHMYGVHNTPWTRNTDFFRMDGTVAPRDRSLLCEEFNKPNNRQIKAFLISHKVGGLGLNLTAANRVILLEANHNPSYDLQCVYRIFRFGQTKQCFVYRLISNGTMEEKVYRKCVVKLAIASTVVDKYHVKRHYSSGDLETMYAYDFDTVQAKPVPKVPKDKLLAALLQSHPEIHTYHEHQALLENTPEEELNDEDKKLAWEEYNHEESKRLPQQNALARPGNRPSGSTYFPPGPNRHQQPPVVPKSTYNHNPPAAQGTSARQQPPAVASGSTYFQPVIQAGPNRHQQPPVASKSTYNYNPPAAQGTSARHQQPAVASGSNYFPPVIQAGPNRHQQPPVVSKGTYNPPAAQATSARHQQPAVASGRTAYLPPVIQAAPPRYQQPTVASGSVYNPSVIQTTLARHPQSPSVASGSTHNQTTVQTTSSGLEPPVSSRPVQDSSRLQTRQALTQEWFQRLSQSAERHSSLRDVQQYGNPYAKPSNHGTTVADNIESIDLSNESEPFNAQHSNVPSNQTNVHLNGAQGEFNYTLNRYQ